MLLQFSPLSLIQELAEATASATVIFWRVLSVPLVQDGFFIRLGNFPMEVTLECTAAHYIIIVAGAVMAYPAFSFRYKIAGLAVLVACILLLNIGRIGMLGLVGYHATFLFTIVHTVVWQGLFALVVVGLWMLWAQGPRCMPRILLRHALPGFVTVLASYFSLSFTLRYYAGLLAAIVNAIGYVISPLVTFPAATGSEHGQIIYLVKDGWAHYRISVDIMNTVVFCSLLSISAPLSDRSRLIKMFSSGFGILFMLHVGYVITYGIICANGIDENTLGDLIRGSAFIAPLIVWILVLRLFRGNGRR